MCALVATSLFQRLMKLSHMHHTHESRVSVNTYDCTTPGCVVVVVVVVVTMMRLPYVNYQAIRVALSLNHKRYRQNAPPTLCQSNIEAKKLHIRLECGGFGNILTCITLSLALCAVLLTQYVMDSTSSFRSACT